MCDIILQNLIRTNLLNNFINSVDFLWFKYNIKLSGILRSYQTIQGGFNNGKFRILCL